MDGKEKQTTAITKPRALNIEQVENVLLRGNLISLSPEQLTLYHKSVCESVGLNPITRPFEYIEFNDDGKPKLELYARKNCTDQLRKLYDVSIKIVARERVGDIYVVTARAQLPNGRVDEDEGALPLKVRRRNKKTGEYFYVTLEGDQLANAMMKACTKAKRRVTLSICGLSFLDESEIESVPGARALSTDASEAPREAKTLPEKKELPRFDSEEFVAFMDGLNLVYDESKERFEQSDALEPAKKKEVSKLFKQARSEPNLALRAELYRKATSLAAMCPDINDETFFKSIIDTEKAA